MKQSLYEDTEFRTTFLSIAVGLSRDVREGYWDDYISREIPRLIREAREHSRTPELDEAYIMGVITALGTRRILDGIEGGEE